MCLLQTEVGVEETSLGGNLPGCLNFSLESLNELNHHGSGNSSGLLGKTVEDSRQVTGEPPPSSSLSNRPGPDPVGSLSDSLYNTFSSCTSQGSNDL